MNTDTIATPEDLAAVIRAARLRPQYLQWLAGRLRSSHEREYRIAAADVIEWFLEGAA